MKIKVNIKESLADLYTPVGLFMAIREHYPNALLMESSDYSSRENAQSIICFDLLKDIEINNHVVTIKNFVDKSEKKTKSTQIVHTLNNFINSFEIENNHPLNGIFGFTAFDAIQYFEPRLYVQSEHKSIPDIKYGFFRFLIIIDHFKDQMKVIENCPITEISKMDIVHSILRHQNPASFPFECDGNERANMTNQDFMDMVKKSKSHCQRGDVFQVVPSRRFEIPFKGDEFNVYRQLRSINPSPYLFYFDYTNFRIFGSSPEAQIKVAQGEAEIHPIAGTVKRTNDLLKDQVATQLLKEDPKENAEHVMLVDLARNDLSKNCTEVKVDKFKEVQYFSHVIHLTSIVKGKLPDNISSYQILADTFPAGTLSGAPKHKAISIIDELEPSHRGLYGGAIGMIGFNNSLNHAIIIRSILSQENTLSIQAGAGITIKSDEEMELAEVNNKLEALKKAIEQSNNNANKSI